MRPERVRETAPHPRDPVPSEGQVMSTGVSRNGASSQRGSIRPLQVLQILGNAIVGGMETYVGNLVTRLPRDEFLKSRVYAPMRVLSPHPYAGSGSRSMSGPFRTIQPGARSK